MILRLSSLRALRPPPGLGRVLRALGVGGVPAGGFFGAGWSLGTLLLLYWLETILVTLVVAILVVRHRRATRKAGHWNAGSVVTTSRGKSSHRTATLLEAFLGVMIPFTAGHGIFVAVFVFLVFPQELGPVAHVSSAALAGGLIAIAAFLLAGLLFDLWGIAERPFSWVERMTQRAQGRMVVTHLTIIFGAGAMAVFDAPFGFLVVFVVLKSLLDFGGLLPDRGSEVEEVPGVVRALGRRLPKKEGRSFSEHYAAEIAAQRTRSEENEAVGRRPARPPRTPPG